MFIIYNAHLYDVTFCTLSTIFLNGGFFSLCVYLFQSTLHYAVVADHNSEVYVMMCRVFLFLFTFMYISHHQSLFFFFN